MTDPDDAAADVGRDGLDDGALDTCRSRRADRAGRGEGLVKPGRRPDDAARGKAHRLFGHDRLGQVIDVID